MGKGCENVTYFHLKYIQYFLEYSAFSHQVFLSRIRKLMLIFKHGHISKLYLNQLYLFWSHLCISNLEQHDGVRGVGCCMCVQIYHQDCLEKL